MQTDLKLGLEIHEHLVKKGIETPMKEKRWIEGVNRTLCIQECVTHILDDLGLDLGDDSLSETPQRVAKMFCEEIFGGLDYANFPKCTVVDNKMGFDEMVLVRNSVLRSTCEHHLQPIYGRIHLGYIPTTKVLGLSKLSRVASFFAARPQIQERLTEQIYATLSYILQTEDVAVVIEAEHFCMKMRGIEDACSSTVTSKMGGRFRTNSDARREVLALIGEVR
jgi:GTP cyclohydrolase I